MKPAVVSRRSKDSAWVACYGQVYFVRSFWLFTIFITPLRRRLRSSSSIKQCWDLSLRRRRRNCLRCTRASQSRMSVALGTTCKVNWRASRKRSVKRDERLKSISCAFGRKRSEHQRCQLRTLPLQMLQLMGTRMHLRNRKNEKRGPGDERPGTLLRHHQGHRTDVFSLRLCHLGRFLARLCSTRVHRTPDGFKLYKVFLSSFHCTMCLKCAQVEYL